MSVARLFRGKGHFELVSALALVKPKHPNVRLAIVGSDYPADSGTTRMLKEHASKLGIGENVIFTGQRSDIAALMAACDVFSLPSFEEPFGLVFAEAMAMKRPVVALTNGGTPEVVEHGKCGLLSPPGDIDALAANLLRLLDDPALRTQFGEYGRVAGRAALHAAAHGVRLCRALCAHVGVKRSVFENVIARRLRLPNNRANEQVTLSQRGQRGKSALLQPPAEVLSVAVGEQGDLAAMRSVGVGKIAAAVFPREGEHRADRFALIRHPAVPKQDNRTITSPALMHMRSAGFPERAYCQYLYSRK